MSTQLKITKWIFAAVFGSVAIGLSSADVFGQGDESAFRSNSSGESKGFGNAFQKIFGTRDKGTEPVSNRPQTPRDSGRGTKPGGIFQGGIVKQFKAVSDDSIESHIRVEESKTVSKEVPLMAPVPTSPSQMAQRKTREPFEVGPSSAASNARSNLEPRNSSARDIFAEDPPSIVGTGVDNRKLNASSMQKNQGSSGSLPPIAKAEPRSTPNLIPPAINSYKNSTNPIVEEELPRISRKTLPNNEPIRNLPSTNSGYALPRNSYAAPNATPHATTANEPVSTRNSINSPTVPIENAPSSNAKPVRVPPMASQPSINTSVSEPAKSTISSGDTRLEMGVPKVKLFISGPPSLQVGKPIPYEVLARNEGTEVLGGVIVSMTIPASVKTSLPVATAGEFESEKDASGVETLLWHVADLGPSQSRIFRVSLEASKPEHFAMDVEWTVLPQTGRIEIAVQQPLLNLSLEGPSEVIWGKPEIYRLRVRNPGNAEVKDVDVRLTAEAYGSNQTKLGTIPAGNERIVEVELTFQQSGTINISGEASSVTSALESKSSINVAVTQIALNADWDCPAEQYQGGIAEYIFKLNNTSPAAAENATCIAIIPSGLKAISMPEGAKQIGNEIRWSVPRIEANASSASSFMFKADEAGDTKIQSNVQCLGGGKAFAEAIVKVESVSDLKLSVTDPIAPAPVGQDVVYDLTIINRGSKTAQSVKLLAQFSHGIEPVRTEGGAARILPGQVVFDPIESIQPGQEITLRVVAQATEAGMHRFRAELECENGDTQLIEEETTRYLATSRTDSSKPTIRR